MRPSRGMGAVKASKMPKAKTITRKDNPDKVEMYAKGGKVKKYNEGGKAKKEPPTRAEFDAMMAERMAPLKITPEQRRMMEREGTPRVTGPDGKPYVPEIRRKAKGGKFIQQAIKKPGALRASLGAKKGEPIPAKKLAKAAKAPGKLGQRARFAEMLKGFRKKK